MKNVKNAHVTMALKPMKIVEIGPKTRLGRWIGTPYVVLALPDGTRTDKLRVDTRSGEYITRV